VANKSYALVTGASSGIGKAIAIELAKRGYNLVMVARTEATLVEAAKEISEKHKVEALPFVADLSDPEAHAQVKLFCVSKKLPINILVNNAGYAVFGFFENIPLQEQIDMKQVNNNAMVSLCYDFIPILKLQPKSYILNVASTASLQAIPGFSIYAASKAFVVMFTRGLKMELAKTNIHVCCVLPGPTTSNFIDRAKMDVLRAASAKFEMPAEKVAQVALKAMFAGAWEVIPGFANAASYIFIKILPKRVAERIAANIYLKALAKL